MVYHSGLFYSALALIEILSQMFYQEIVQRCPSNKRRDLCQITRHLIKLPVERDFDFSWKASGAVERQKRQSPSCNNLNRIQLTTENINWREFHIFRQR